MPAKPAWFRNLPHIIQELETSTRPYVDRPTVEYLFGVRRRRAQQIMAPCISERVGSSGLADRVALVARLKRLAMGDDAHYEARRLLKVVGLLEQLRKERINQPRLLVEAPAAVVHQEFDGLPAGITISPGRIAIEFGDLREALEKLLALAMAISNDFTRFEGLVEKA